MLYASNFISFVNYEGHDGNPYEAYGAGAYKFVVSFKEGINTYNIFDSSKSQINVAWAKSSGGELLPVPPVPDNEETPELDVPPMVTESPEIFVSECDVSDKGEEVFVVETVQSVSATRAKVREIAAVTPVQHVCDRIKRLVFCTETQLKDFRKQY